MASVILFVVDARQGMTSLDEQVAKRLRYVTKPILCVANKCDSPELDSQAAEFYRLGRGKLVCVSAEQKRGIASRVFTAQMAARIFRPGADGAPAKIMPASVQDPVAKTAVTSQPSPAAWWNPAPQAPATPAAEPAAAEPEIPAAITDWRPSWS